MAGEPILIVDDTPVNLKLTRILLVKEGYKVLTATSAEEALDLLHSSHPQLVLTDIQLPGIDGLEFTRRLKSNPATRDIKVLALTAFAMAGDEQKAREAGCDGYITKPIDTRSLGARIREHLGNRLEAHAAAAGDSGGAVDGMGSGIPPSELRELRRRFLDEGLERAQQFLLDLDGQFNAREAVRAVHQWIGAGGLLGYSAISRLAREVEAVMLERPLDNSQVRESLTNLVTAFSSPREARDTPIPESVLESLTGKRVAVVGFPFSERERLTVALERAQADPRFLEASAAPDPKMLQGYDLLAVHVRPETMESPWLDPDAMKNPAKPTVFVGNRDHLMELDSQREALAREYLMDSWTPEEALVRLSLAVSGHPAAPLSALSIAGRSQVLIADHDPSVVESVRDTIPNFGMDCHVAADGDAAIAAIRQLRPHAAVLDVNIPGKDGYEVLSAIRKAGIPMRVIMIIARQQEGDVIRGFSLGADDYIVKPFSPMELVARLKRLLGK